MKSSGIIARYYPLLEGSSRRAMVRLTRLPLDCETREKKMIGYVTVGTNDLPRAAAFYDALLGELLGAKRAWESEGGIGWADKRGVTLAAMKPFNGEAATVGNGMMVALSMKTKEAVDAFYAKAISLGAKDEGPAGPRGSSFYAGYFRDLDGNKLCAFCMIS
jgi:predicted lactoylglutathione lyase